MEMWDVLDEICGNGRSDADYKDVIFTSFGLFRRDVGVNIVLISVVLCLVELKTLFLELLSALCRSELIKLSSCRYQRSCPSSSASLRQLPAGRFCFLFFLFENAAAAPGFTSVFSHWWWNQSCVQVNSLSLLSELLLVSFTLSHIITLNDY